MKTVTLQLPEDVAKEVFAHLNGDDGWRSTVGDRFVRASENRGDRRKVDAMQATVVALGAFSAALAKALQP